jgi:hypothetical protein
LFEEHGQATVDFVQPQFPALPCFIVEDVWGDETNAALSVDGRLRPVLINYDEKQQPVNKQLVEIVNKQRSIVTIPWR